MVGNEHLRVESLSKRFGSVTALDDVSFDARHGEIHCLLGENGAGKSTLSECMYGFYRPDSGQIYVDRAPVTFHSPRDAIRSGLGMVHQHFVLVPTLTVLENITLGTHSSWRLNNQQARARLHEICERYSISADLDAKVWQLSVGEQQWVEILKALYLDAKLLILDEPTAVLTPQESERLFAVIRRMTENNLSVVLITHKLNEVMQSDRVTILRKGKVVDTVETKKTTKERLISMMVGRSVALQPERTQMLPGQPVLSVSNVSITSDRGVTAVKDLSFEVRSSEILGIAGVAGNGQRELFEALVGARKIDRGSIHLAGRCITNRDSKSIIDSGIGYIPDDRYKAGLVGDFSIEENLALGLHDRNNFSKRGFLKFAGMETFARESIDAFGIVASSTKAKASSLSGGNAQKIILARELWSSTSCLLANQPTRGLDVGAIEFVHRMLLKKRAEGFAILLASEELDDILGLADRIAVMFKGQFMGVFKAGEIDVVGLGHLMAGHRNDVRQERSVIHA